MSTAGVPAATSPLRREAGASSQVSRPSGVPDGSQHVQGTGAGFPFYLLVLLLFLSLSRAAGC